MKKTILIFLAVLLGTSSAHAERWPATRYGLTPETGFLNAVTVGETCNPKTDVLVFGPSDDQLEYITRCDRSPIGWVTRDVRGRDLSPDESQDHVFRYSRSGNLAHRRGGLDPYDYQIDLGAYYDKWENDTINIYTCDDSRKDELEKFPQIKPSKDAEQNFLKLKRAQIKGKNISIQLFFNEYIYSGKCIGAIYSN